MDSNQKRHFVYFIFLVFSVISVHLESHTFYHIIIPILAFFYSIKNKLHYQFFKSYIFYTLVYWTVFKNNCVLNVYNEKEIKTNNKFISKIIGISSILLLIIIIHKSFTLTDKILLFYILVSAVKFRKFHNSSLRYINLFIIYLVFLKYFKNINLEIKISMFLNFTFYNIYFQKLIVNIIKCNYIDRIIAFLIPISTFISI